jgi:hypothetical protein
MKRPPDHLDPPGGRSERLDRLLSAARGDTATPAQMRMLGVRLAALAPVSAAAVTAKAAATGAARFSMLAKVGLAGLAVAGLTTAGVVRWTRPATSRPAPHAAPVSPAAPAIPEAAPRPVMMASPPAAPPEPARRPRRQASSTVPPPAARAPIRRMAAASAVEGVPARVAALPAATPPETATPSPAPQAQSPAPEQSPAPAVSSSEARALLEARALVPVDPESALERIELQEERLPVSRLAQERELIAIDALLRLGRVEQARARAHSFRQKYPGSAHLRRLEALEARARP